jgi:tetratricopeptide (TPR) repeat protein
MNRRGERATGRASLLALSLLLALGGADDVVAQARETDLNIQFFQSRVARRPDDFLSYGKLGEAYIQKARETGDITYYDLAEGALKRSLELRPGRAAAASATTQLALVYFTRHQFQDALAYAERALGYGSGRLSPYAIIGDAYIELGQYEKAEAAYSKMLALRGPLYPHARLSYLRFLRGEMQGAIEEMQQGVEALRDAHVARENLAWTQVQLGDLLFQTGEPGKAETAYGDALTSYPGYHRALAGLGKVRAAQARSEEAIDLYRRALGVIPLPEYAAALGDVCTKAGRLPEAKKQYDLVEYIGYLNTLNRAVYNRELALFYTDHDLKLPQALELAERELEVRRDVYTYDVVAWALHKSGKSADALAAMAEALKLGTKDARLFFHAGMIHRAAGDIEKARDYLQRALATNPHFHLLQADVARRTLKELDGQPTQR